MSRGHQTDFPAEQPEAQAPARIPFAHGDEERPKGAGAPPRQGPQAAQRLDTGIHSENPNKNDQPLAIERLKLRREFLFVADGLAERKRNLVVQARNRATPRPAAGAGFTATRKVGNSVVRNRARRRLREAARDHLPVYGLPGVDYVFIARQDTGECPWPRLLDDMESALISLRRRLAGGAEDLPRPRKGRPPTTRPPTTKG